MGIDCLVLVDNPTERSSAVARHYLALTRKPFLLEPYPLDDMGRRYQGGGRGGVMGHAYALCTVMEVS